MGYDDHSNGRKVMICGLRKWVFFSILGVVGILVTVGAVVGGVVGSRNSNGWASARFQYS